MRDLWREEEGFTLIELVVALSVLAVAVAATATVFYAGIRTGSADTHRVNGVALASRMSDQLRLVAYDRLGMADGTSSSNDPVCDSASPIVIVANPAVAASDPPASTANVTYTVQRCVQWVADSHPWSSQSYKRTTVVVSWSDVTGSHTVRQDSIAYPGGLGPAGTTTTTTAPSCTGSPLPAAVVVPSSASPLAARLTWVTPLGSPVPIESWIVQYSTDGFTTTNTATDDLATAPPNGFNTFVVGGLSSSTAYAFRVIAVGPAACAPVPRSTAAQTSLTTGTGTAVAGCVALLVSVSPTVAQRDPGTSSLAPQSVRVTVNTNGNCSGLVATYAPNAGATGSVTLSSNGAVWSGTVPAALATDAWDLGQHTISITQAGVAMASADLCVVNAGVTAC